jgi:dTDP-4-amino-4,6-dideoxygalactose transaminase
MMKNTASVVNTAAAAPGTPALDRRLRFIKPTLPPLDDVLSVYRQGYSQGLLTNGDVAGRFEAAVGERLGVKHCIAVSSCTSGLMLVMKALGLRGEVILPSFTFFATGHALLWNGLEPVFADCDPETWTLDPADVDRKITERTSAVVGVHLYGNPCFTEELEDLAARRSLKLIFDGAHALGSVHRGRPIGQFGDAEVFSLSPTKLLVAGEGGLVTTNDATLARQIRAGRNYGDLGAYDPELLGLSARMPEFNAALGLAGLGILDHKIARHNAIAARYTAALSSTPGLCFQRIRSGDVCTFKDYSVLVDAAEYGRSRDELAVALLGENIETKKYFYPPLHRQNLYRRFDQPRPGGLAQTDLISGSVLSFPIYESLPDETVDAITSAVRRLAK